MADFKGERACSLDAKGRLVIPARLREELGERFVMTRWWECVTIFPQGEWERFKESLNAFSALDEDADELKHYFISGAVDCELDKMGRVGIPTHLMQDFELGKEVVVAGMIDRVEIWNKALWDEKKSPARRPEIRAKAKELLRKAGRE